MKWINPQRWLFEWRYWRGRTPWDTDITPPEVVSFLGNTPAGKALDLGCGTGTNAITLAVQGWHVTGVDFAPRAIRTANRKAGRAGVEIDFRVGDVSNLSDLTGPYDFALDIGCLHALEPEGRTNYAAGLARLLRSGADFMLYAWLPRDWGKSSRGLSPEQVENLFSPHFHVTRIATGKDQGCGSAWYWMKKA